MKAIPLQAIRSGFTLVELLVASVISLILVGLLLVATQSISTNYTRSQGDITRRGDAAFALDQLIQDLEGYVIPNVPHAEGLRTSTETVGGITNAVWLTLLSTSLDSDNSDPNGTNNFTGATRAISYRLAYQNSIDASSESPSYSLYRSVASAKHTFQNAVTATNLQANYWAALPASPAPTPGSTTAVANFLAENVVGFSLRFLLEDGTWTAPGDRVRIGRDGISVNNIPIKGKFKRAEVAITVLSPEGAQRVRDGVLSLPEAITKHGQTSVAQTAFF